MMRLNWTGIFLAGTLTLLVLSASVAWSASDPLPSWRASPVRQRLVAFVEKVSTPDSGGYVSPTARIAVFDDDGTLWPEKPRAQGMFALQRLRGLAPEHPEWRTEMPYKAALELGSKYLEEASDEAVFQLLVTAHGGRTQETFRQDVRDFFATAKNPRLGKRYLDLTYQPMRELLTYLKANGFRIFISTTGSVTLVQVLAEDLYGISGDDVLGSTVVTTLQEADGQLLLRRLSQINNLNNGPRKPMLMDMQVGRRPILAVGNIHSGGHRPASLQPTGRGTHSANANPARRLRPGIRLQRAGRGVGESSPRQ